MALLLVGGCRQLRAQLLQSPKVYMRADLLKEFKERVNGYAKLQKEQEAKLPRLKGKADAPTIKAHEQALAAAIQQERKAARPGDVFIPGVQPEFVRIVRSALKGPDGVAIRKAIKDDKPDQVALRVNQPYTADKLSAVPPQLLLSLPPLPKELEYRFVNRSLVLRDARANMVVDYIPGVLPS